MHYVDSQHKANLRQRLKQAALANIHLNLEIAEEWFQAEQESWQRLEKEEQAITPRRQQGSARPRPARAR